MGGEKKIGVFLKSMQSQSTIVERESGRFGPFSTSRSLPLHLGLELRHLET